MTTTLKTSKTTRREYFIQNNNHAAFFVVVLVLSISSLVGGLFIMMLYYNDNIDWIITSKASSSSSNVSFIHEAETQQATPTNLNNTINNTDTDNHHNSTSSNSRTKKQGVWWDYPLNISELLKEAQIPPPHSPWHVLPKSWQEEAVLQNTTTTNATQQHSHYQQMLHDVQRFIVEDGLSQNVVTKQRLCLIRQGTLLKQTNQTLSNNNRWPEIEDMFQNALDVGRHILQTTNLTLSHHELKLLKWLVVGDDNDDDDDNKNIPNTFPILISKDDYKGCSYYSTNDTKYHIPWFTFAMESAIAKKEEEVSSSTSVPSNCIPFALPCYDMWTRLKDGLKYTPQDWFLKRRRRQNYPGCQRYGKWDLHHDVIFDKFPWQNKISKVVWRGSTTGAAANEVSSWKHVPRFQLVSGGMNHPDVMDFGFVELNQGWEQEPFRTDILADLGPLRDKIKFTDFMNYQAVLDINGNSWSSRFGHLMCLNSVVLKVETNDYVNYFESPGGTNGSPELVPWIHYVPIHQNLSNLEEVTKYVLDPKNVDEIHQIIQNANDWCQHKMTVTQFAIDVLWMLLNYVDLLYLNGPSRSNQHQEGDNEQDDIYDSVQRSHPLNFTWMDQYVYQSSHHEWERAFGTRKTSFELQNVKVHRGFTYPY